MFFFYTKATSNIIQKRPQSPQISYKYHTSHLKDHTDREANPGTHGASDGGDERGERVARRLRDRFHIQRHEIDLKSGMGSEQSVQQNAFEK